MRAELEALEEVLHNAIIASLRNPLIDTSYRRIHNYLRILRLDRKITAPLALRSLREHLAIIEACRHRNADRGASRAANPLRQRDAAEHGPVLKVAGGPVDSVQQRWQRFCGKALAALLSAACLQLRATHCLLLHVAHTLGANPLI